MLDEPADAPADIITSVGAGPLAEAAARRNRYAQLDAEVRDLNAKKRHKAAEMAALMPQILDDFVELGIDSARAVVGDERKAIYIDTKLWAGPRKTGVGPKGELVATDADWARAVSAACAAGCGHLVQERFNGISFTSWLREFRDEHGPQWRDALPAEFLAAIDITDDPRIGVRKA